MIYGKLQGQINERQVKELLSGTKNEAEAMERLVVAQQLVDLYWEHKRKLEEIKHQWMIATEMENDRWRDRQRQCPHWLTQYFPDASGNNDSETRCLLCDKEL